MNPRGWWLSVVWVLVIALGAGYAFGGATAKGTTGAMSGCAAAGGPAAWSPDGRRIAYVGSAGTQRHAICVASANGADARRVGYTACGCGRGVYDVPIQLDWARSNLLLYLDNFKVFKLQIGQRPQLLGKTQGEIDSIAVDAKGDRVALGSSVCTLCRGPITVLSVPSGRILSKIGGPEADNYSPTLSPDGKRVAFIATEPRIGVWTASASGSNLRPLKHCGDTTGGTPFWSPDGDKIACLGLPRRAPHTCCSLTLVSPRGGPSTTIVPRQVGGHFLAWSPNGKSIVFEAGHCECRLAVIDLQTRKTHLLPDARGANSAAWSPDSRQLLATESSRVFPNCSMLWRIPAQGGQTRLLRNCP
jgi:Tol biopolymer transport system component